MSDKNNLWALHAVIIKKPYNIDEAKNEAKKYIKNNKLKFYRETTQSFRFRNIPKQKFIKNAFKTKKINKNLSLVFGILKEGNEHLQGAGIFDLFKKPIQAVKNFFSPRMGYNNTTNKNLTQWGNLIIKDLTIARTPIMGILDKTINILSLGKFNKLKAENSFDKLFHLSLIANVGQKSLVVEKNEVINVNTTYKVSSDTEVLKVPLDDKKFTLNMMLDETRKRIGDNMFYLYDPFKFNCQVFIKDLLSTMGLYGEKEKNFLFQDLTDIAQKMPSLTKKVMKFTTDLGAVANKIMGKGKRYTDSMNEEEQKEYHDEIIKELNKAKKYFKKNYDNLQKLQKLQNAISDYINSIRETEKNHFKEQWGFDDFNKIIEEIEVSKGISTYNKYAKKFNVDPKKLNADKSYKTNKEAFINYLRSNNYQDSHSLWLVWEFSLSNESRINSLERENKLIDKSDKNELYKLEFKHPKLINDKNLPKLTFNFNLDYPNIKKIMPLRGGYGSSSETTGSNK